MTALAEVEEEDLTSPDEVPPPAAAAPARE